MSYLKHKPGSIEELMANEASKLNDNAYQDMFKKELDKAGKGIGSMTPKEKKDFFNKIDDKYKAKNENIKEGRYEVTGTVTYQGVSGEDEVTVVVDAMDKMDAEDVADDMIDDLRRAKKIGPKRGGQVKNFYPFDVEYTRKKEGLVDKMMEKVDEPYAVGMAQAMKAKNDEPPLKKSTITKAHDIAKSIEKDQKESVSESIFTDTKNDGQGKSVSQIQQMLKREIQKGNFVGADKYTIIEPGLTPGMKQDMTIKHNDLLQAIKKHGATGFRVMPMGESIEKNEEVSKVVPAGSHKMPDGTIMKDKDHKKEVKEEDAYDKDDEKPKSKPKKETHSFMTKDMNKSKKDAKGEKEIVDPEPKIKQESLQDAIKSVWQLSAEELEKMKSEAKYMKAQRMNQYKAEKDDKNKTGTADTGSKKTKVDVEPSVDYKN